MPERTQEQTPEPSWAQVEPETRALRRLQTAMAEAEIGLARRLGLGHSELAAMTHLASSAAPIGPGQLSRRLGVTPAAATELVDRLERAGHLERRRDTVDRRRIHLIPSRSALADVGGRLAPLLAELDASARTFDATERAAIQRFLESAVRAYTEFDEESSPPGTASSAPQN